MLHHKLKYVFVLMLVLGSATMLLSHDNWGFWAHKRVNRLAIYTLPPEMIVFYKQNSEWITEHAVDPDKRRYAIKEEAPRHYIDLDQYCKLPCDELPHNWKDAVAKYTEDSLMLHGIVPWHVTLMVYKLTEAFKIKNKNLILKYSAELGHYVGDAHVPLHTTHNYNGQLTGQKGIHGFWESRIPELFADKDYDYFVGAATYVKSTQEFIWSAVLASHAAVDSVLMFERELTKKYDEDKKYTFEERANQTIKTYSYDFSKDYQALLDNQVERRMRAAILGVGSLWYTAWVNAGQPDLSSIADAPWSEEELKEFEAIDAKVKEGKIFGHEHE
jgi:hypothetical protein